MEKKQRLNELYDEMHTLARKAFSIADEIKKLAPDERYQANILIMAGSPIITPILNGEIEDLPKEGRIPHQATCSMTGEPGGMIGMIHHFIGEHPDLGMIFSYAMLRTALDDRPGLPRMKGSFGSANSKPI